MIDLGNFGLGSAAIVAAILILLLTPLFGEIYGRFFEEAATVIAKPLRTVAEIIEGIKDWALRVVGLRFSRQDPVPEPAQPVAAQPVARVWQDTADTDTPLLPPATAHL